MKATRNLHESGQSLWMKNITRGQLNSGLLGHCIDDCSVTGLTMTAASFKPVFKNDTVYDASILTKLKQGLQGEKLFLDIVLEDLKSAADLFRPIYDRTDGVDGWVSMELSPLLSNDWVQTLSVAEDLYNRARRPNLMIAIPGTTKMLTAVEEAIFAGIPVNVTLLFSRVQYIAAAEAYLRGIERRIASGLKPDVASVSSFFVNRLYSLASGKVPDELCRKLDAAMAKQTYKSFRELLSTPRFEHIHNAGARPQRLLWTGTEPWDSKNHLHYTRSIAAPLTITALTETRLNAPADHEDTGTCTAEDAKDCETMLSLFARAGVDIDPLAAQAQQEGVNSLVETWIELLTVIASKSATLIQIHNEKNNKGKWKKS